MFKVLCTCLAISFFLKKKVTGVNSYNIEEPNREPFLTEEKFCPDTC